MFSIRMNKHFRSDICQRLSSICSYRIVPVSQDVCKNMYSLLKLYLAVDGCICIWRYASGITVFVAVDIIF